MTSPISQAALAAALFTELTRSLQTAIADVATSEPAAPPTGLGWQLKATATGPFNGSVTLWIDRPGALALVAQLLDTESPPDAAVSNRLRELWAEVTSAVELGAPDDGLTLLLSSVEAAAVPEHAEYADVTAGSLTARLAIAVQVRQPAAFAEGQGLGGQTPIEALLDIDLPLVVRFARTVMSIKTLSAVGPGTVVDMERSPDAPVELLVGDRVIAHGEVVVVGGNYGVRVTKLCSPDGRARSMEA